MIWLKWALGVVAAGMGLWLLLSAHGERRWQARTDTLVDRMNAARVAQDGRRFDPAALADLPAPVQRYLRAALTPGQPVVAGVSLSHDGRFNMGEGKDNWKPFSSAQWVTTARPGFVWDGTIRMAPGLPVRVHDAYIAGEGLLVPAILGLFKLTEMRGGEAIARGELMRWLAEAPWYPTALLPGQGVTWTPIDDQSALASVTDGDVTVALTFRFGSDDLVASIRAEARDRTLGGTLVATPWEGIWSGYSRRDGMLVPMTGEVAWILPEGRKPYWQGRVTALDYRFAE